MRDFSKVAPQFWTGDTGRRLRALGPEVQVIALYLITCPSSSMIGLFYLPLPTLCHETGRGFEGASKALLDLEKARFCEYDRETELVWVPEMARFQIGEALSPNDKRAVGLKKDLIPFRKSRFYKKFLDRYAERYHLRDLPEPEAPSEPLRRPIEAPSKEHPTEIEIEQEIENKINNTLVPGDEPILTPPTSRPRKRSSGQVPYLALEQVFNDRFWPAYPRHDARKDALRAWVKLHPSPELVERILVALEAQKRAGRFDGDPKYIPMGSTWLNRARWEDPPAPAGFGNGTGARPSEGRVIPDAEETARRNREQREADAKDPPISIAEARARGLVK